jgi:hypothetical protein
MEITFELIEPLVKKSSFEASKLTCLFRAANSTRSVEASVNIYPSRTTSNSTMSQIKLETGSTVSYYLRQIFQRFLGSQLSSSISRVTDQFIRTIASKPALSKKEQREAIVRAFQSVSHQFEYMEGAWRMREQ